MNIHSIISRRRYGRIVGACQYFIGKLRTETARWYALLEPWPDDPPLVTVSRHDVLTAFLRHRPEKAKYAAQLASEDFWQDSYEFDADRWQRVTAG